MEQPNYYVMVGNFGSGKTELALDFAYRSAAGGLPTTLVDLDIVNPYFRASEREKSLTERGVRLITPRFAMSNVEIITIDPSIYSAFVGDRGTVIFDVGGDNVGARALGQYREYFNRIPAENLHVWLVVNAYRPLSGSGSRIVALLRKIEDEGRLPVEGLINNSNLSRETTGQELLHGYEIIREAAEQSGLPVVYTSGEQAALTEFLSLAKERGLDPRFIGRPLPIVTEMHRDWERFAKYGI